MCYVKYSYILQPDGDTSVKLSRSSLFSKLTGNRIADDTWERYHVIPTPLYYWLTSLLEVGTEPKSTEAKRRNSLVFFTTAAAAILDWKHVLYL